jgi:hypothetical protein
MQSRHIYGSLGLPLLMGTSCCNHTLQLLFEMGLHDFHRTWAHHFLMAPSTLLTEMGMGVLDTHCMWTHQCSLLQSLLSSDMGVLDAHCTWTHLFFISCFDSLVRNGCPGSPLHLGTSFHRPLTIDQAART